MMSRQLFDLTGRVALVTGGSKGLGKAMARGFAEAGADVVISSRHDEELIAAEADIQAGTNVRVAHFVADMTQREDVRRLADRALAAMGRVDILVNNAGSNLPQPTEQIVDEDWDRLVELNLELVHGADARAGRADEGTPMGAHHQRVVDFGPDVSRGKKCLFRHEKRLDRPDARRRERSGIVRHHGQLPGARAVLDRPSSQSLDGRAAGGLRPENDSRSLGEAGGTRGAGVAPGKRGGKLHHRHHAGGGWRLPGQDVLRAYPERDWSTTPFACP